MSIDVILITTGSRPDLLKQSLRSLSDNRHDHSTFSLRIVWDCQFNQLQQPPEDILHKLIDYGDVIILRQSGASRARNIGASSIPKYRRQSHVMFIDDDVYMCPDWDTQLLNAADLRPHSIWSGHAHPFNHTVTYEDPRYLATTVISTVHMMMPWPIWDAVGYFTEPGGPGGSEDVDYCNRATQPGKAYPLLITKPHCVIHTGLTGSNGKPIVGVDLVRQRNKEIERIYAIEGKVQYQ